MRQQTSLFLNTKCQGEVTSGRFSQEPGAALSTEERADGTLRDCCFPKQTRVSYRPLNMVQPHTELSDTDPGFKEFMVQEER